MCANSHRDPKSSGTPPPFDTAATSASAWLVVDLEQEDNARIASAAERLSALLGDSGVVSDSNVSACLDDLVGTVHGLYMARLLHFEDRMGGPIELAAVQKRALDLKVGMVRTDGKWLAGFYFNGALFRLASIYHRALKVVAGTPETRDFIGPLRQRAESQYRAWAAREWDAARLKKIHDEVNALKHAASGLYASRNVSFDDAVGALHELLELVEQWASQIPKHVT